MATAAYQVTVAVLGVVGVGVNRVAGPSVNVRREKGGNNGSKLARDEPADYISQGKDRLLASPRWYAVIMVGDETILQASTGRMMSS